jgi:hypothetical protein
VCECLKNILNDYFYFSKERNVEKIKIGRDERFREIRNFMQTMQIKLDERFKSKFNALNGKM